MRFRSLQAAVPCGGAGLSALFPVTDQSNPPRLNNNRRSVPKPPPWHVTLVANLLDEFEPEEDDPPDAGSEFDKGETIAAITSALESHGHRVSFASADHRLPQTLLDLQPDICFNIAEGIAGDGREAQVPALCELLRIPYTASNITSNAIALDKTKTKRIWRDHHLPTADFQEFTSPPAPRQVFMQYPLLVKPAREGTGMGINELSVVRHHDQLADRVDWVTRTYRQPALVEKFLPGREFTVGFIGNPAYLAGSPPDTGIYDADGYHWFPVLEIGSEKSISPTVYGNESKSFYIGEQGAPDYLCPADISEELRSELIRITRSAAQALDVYDISRLDFRLDENDRPQLLEINTLPGLNPAISDICIMAQAEGFEYTLLINEVLYLAARRFGLLSPQLRSHVGVPQSVNGDTRS